MKTLNEALNNVQISFKRFVFTILKELKLYKIMDTKEIKDYFIGLLKKYGGENFTHKEYIEGLIDGCKTALTISNAIYIISAIAMIYYATAMIINSYQMREQNKILINMLLGE